MLSSPGKVVSQNGQKKKPGFTSSDCGGADGSIWFESCDPSEPCEPSEPCDSDACDSDCDPPRAGFSTAAAAAAEDGGGGNGSGGARDASTCSARLTAASSIVAVKSRMSQCGEGEGEGEGSCCFVPEPLMDFTPSALPTADAGGATAAALPAAAAAAGGSGGAGGGAMINRPNAGEHNARFQGKLGVLKSRRARFDTRGSTSPYTSAAATKLTPAPAPAPASRAATAAAALAACVRLCNPRPGLALLLPPPPPPPSICIAA